MQNHLLVYLRTVRTLSRVLKTSEGLCKYQNASLEHAKAGWHPKKHTEICFLISKNELDLKENESTDYFFKKAVLSHLKKEKLK